MSEDIARIFATDPLSLTRQDIDDMIIHYRQNRAQFNLGLKPPAKKKGVEKVDKVDLGELDL